MPRRSTPALALLSVALITGCPTVQPEQPTRQQPSPAPAPTKEAGLTKEATPAPTKAAVETPAPAPASAHEPAAPWTLRYHDGSNNGTVFSRAAAGGDVLFEYNPMTPAKSSSGTYSGGAARTGVATPTQVARLWDLVKKLEGATEAHAERRSMGTGSLKISTPEGERSLLIRAGAELSELDALLKPLQGR